MWRRDLAFACVCLTAIALVVQYVSPRRKFDQDHSLVVLDNSSAGTVANLEDDISAIVERLDDAFQSDWEAAGLKPAATIDRLTMTRRISLGLTGTIPSLEEIRQIEKMAPTTVGQHWLSYLFTDRRFGDHVAERFARALVGVEEGPFLIFRRRRFVSWFSDQLMENRGFDELASEIVTSSGLWTDSPGVNFLTVTTNPELEDRPDPVRLAGRTTRAFLGVRLDCMQCHDDNLEGEWLQSNFHELAAFYNQSTTTLVGLLDKDRKYKFQYLDEPESVTVDPQVPFHQELLPSEGPLRERLAAWMTDPENRPFARTTVNRVWAVLFGKPLVEPIDSIPLDGPFPPGLELLVDDLIEHDFDLQRLMRIIVASRPFRLDSAADHEMTTEHEQHWASFPMTRLRPEQIAGALLQSARLNTVDGGSHVLLRLARYGETNDFIRDYGDVGEDEFTAAAGTIPQRLVMMNGQLVKERTKRELLYNAATRIARLAPSNVDAIESAYLAVLTRRPTDEEAAYFQHRFDERTLDSPEQVGDLCWTLINSNEFGWNH